MAYRPEFILAGLHDHEGVYYYDAYGPDPEKTKQDKGPYASIVIVGPHGSAYEGSLVVLELAFKPISNAPSLRLRSKCHHPRCSKEYLAYKELDTLAHTLRIHDLIMQFIKELCDPLPAARAVDEWCRKLVCRATTPERSAALWNESIVRQWIRSPERQQAIARQVASVDASLQGFIEQTVELHCALRVRVGAALPALPAQELPMYTTAVASLGFQWARGMGVLEPQQQAGADSALGAAPQQAASGAMAGTSSSP